METENNKELTLWNRCQQQAALLDKKVPGWYKDVDPERLNMGSRQHCIVGQCSFFEKKFRVNHEQQQLRDLGLESGVFAYDLFEQFGGLDIASTAERIREVRSEVEHMTNQLTKYWKTLVRQRHQRSREDSKST